MKLYCLGASNPEAVRLISAVQKVDPSLEMAGFLDNDPNKWGSAFHGHAVLGGLDLVARLAGQGAAFVNLITRDAITRYQTTAAIVSAGGVLANLIHPTTNVDMVTFGVGLYIQEAVSIQAGVEIGDNSSFSSGAIISHETRIGRGVFLAPGATIAGCCTVGDGVFIGANATILPRLQIGSWSTVGAGAVVTKHVPDGAVVAGNPARIIRYNAAPVAKET